MSRTNIDLDDELLERVMGWYGFQSKREAVDYALRQIDIRPLTDEEFLAMEGSGWEGDLDEMRRMDRSLEEWIEEQDRNPDELRRLDSLLEKWSQERDRERARSRKQA